MEKLKFTQLDIRELVASTFPYNKELEVTEILYFSKGLYDWKTFYIFLNDKIINFNYLLILCKHSDKTRKIFIEKENIEQIQSKLKTSSNHARFFWKTNLVPSECNNALSTNEAYRLVSYLKERGVELFEPTK